MSSLIPSGWALSKINDTCDVFDSQRIPLNTQERALRKGHYPYYGANGVQGFIDDFIFDGEYVLLAEDGGYFEEFSSRPISYLVSGKFWVNNHAHILQAKKGHETKYIHYSLVHKNILKHINGGTRSKLNQSDMRDIEYLAPPLPEQQKIATILSSVDDVIEKTRAQIDKLKDLKTGMMQELLTKGIGHAEFKDSPVGQVPEGWQLLSMRDICSVRQGLQIPISERHSKPSNNRWVYLTIRYINTGFDKSVAEYIENPKSSVVCTEDDIILARTGATGKVVTGINGVFHNNFFMVDYDRVKTVKNFLVQYLNSPFVQHEISNRAGTTTIPDLNHGDFYTIPMILPPVAEQLKLAEVLESLDILISNKISKYAAMEKAKKALMQDLLTGKVRVKPNKSAAL